MWHALIIVACLSAPDEMSCRMVTLDIEKCTRAAVVPAHRKWQQEHPGWRVVRARCEWGRTA